jgi:hypothetical protein
MSKGKSDKITYKPYEQRHAFLIPRAYIRTAGRVWKEENEEYGDRDLEELGGKEKFTSANVRELAGILREKIERLGEAEDKKN